MSDIIIPRLKEDYLLYFESDLHWKIKDGIYIPREDKRIIVLNNGDVFDDKPDREALMDIFGNEKYEGISLTTNKSLKEYLKKHRKTEEDLRKFLIYGKQKFLDTRDKENVSLSAVLGNHEIKLITEIAKKNYENLARKLKSDYVNYNWFDIDEDYAKLKDLAILRVHNDENLKNFLRKEHFDILQTHDPKKIEYYDEILKEHEYMPKILTVGHNHIYLLKNAVLFNFRLKNKRFAYVYDPLKGELSVYNGRVNLIHPKSINFFEYARKNGERYLFEIIHPGIEKDFMLFDNDNLYFNINDTVEKINYKDIIKEIGKRERYKAIFA